MKHRIIVVGAGRMGQNHIRTVDASPDFELVAVVDPAAPSDAHSLEDLEADYDCAIVATPTPTHYDIVQELLHQGKIRK